MCDSLFLWFFATATDLFITYSVSLKRKKHGETTTPAMICVSLCFEIGLDLAGCVDMADVITTQLHGVLGGFEQQKMKTG